MLCASIDSPKNILLDNQKYLKIRELEDTNKYYFNQKYDGLRIGLARLPDGSVSIPNRRGVDYAKTKNVPEIEAAAKIFPPDTLIDGEGGVMCDPKNCPAQNRKCQGKQGHLCRSLTQTRFASKTNYSQDLIKRLPAIFIAWDIRRLAGEDLEQLPLTTRLRILTEFMVDAKAAGAYPLQLAEYQEKGAVEMFKGEPEGIVAKLKDSPYVPMDEDTGSDRRPRLWIKIKHTYIEIVNVEGYCSDSEGRLSSVELRNLVVTKNGEYVGTVGGGFSDSDRVKLKQFFGKYQTMNAPYALASKVKSARTFVYVPNTGLQLRIAYQEITANNIRYAPRCLDILWPQTAHPIDYPIPSGATLCLANWRDTHKFFGWNKLKNKIILLFLIGFAIAGAGFGQNWHYSLSQPQFYPTIAVALIGSAMMFYAGKISKSK
jgi:ATP-dependent DNA ligase